jgi:hypothetical protein
MGLDEPHPVDPIRSTCLEMTRTDSTRYILPPNYSASNPFVHVRHTRKLMLIRF